LEFPAGEAKLKTVPRRYCCRQNQPWTESDEPGNYELLQRVYQV